jgi:hypothetical protein
MLVEAAFVLPLLIFMIGALIVMSIRISDNMYLGQSSRELAIKLARLPWIAEAGTGTSTWQIDIDNAQGEPSETTAAACLDTLNDPSYDGCGSTGCNPCIETVILWYTYKLMRAKNMFVEWPVTLQVTFGPPIPEDPTAAKGLCYITVQIAAIHRGWLLGLDGNLTAYARAPYVSNPVPAAGSSCALY